VKKTINTLLDFFELALLGTLIFITVYFLIGQLVEVSGDSMEPNFKNGQQMIAEKLTINITKIQRGDIVIFNSLDTRNLLIKRVIGLPGEKIKIQDGLVYINDTHLDEPYLVKNTYTKLKYNNKMEEGKDYEIGEDSYVVLGDNREVSIDSRAFGSLHKNDILGKVILRYYPIKDFRII